MDDSGGRAHGGGVGVSAEISVIIAAHDAASTIGRQLQALCSQRDAPPFTVIVVANRCRDATVAVASGFGDRLDLVVRAADEQPGAGHARNVGASLTDSRLLLFCDADDEVGVDWVAAMVDALRSGRADFVGGRIEVDRAGLPDWIYRWCYRYLDGTCIQGHDQPRPSMLTASFGVTAEAFARVGGFDEGFGGAGWEDTDLCWRLLQAGFRAGEAPGATIRYEPRRTSTEVLERERSRVPGGLRFQQKHGLLADCPSAPAFSAYLVRSLAALVLRDRVVHPSGAYVLVRREVDRWRAHRRLEASDRLGPRNGRPTDHR